MTEKLEDYGTGTVLRKHPAQSEPMPPAVKAWRDALLEAMNGKSVVTIHNAAANMLAWINTRWPESEAGR